MLKKGFQGSAGGVAGAVLKFRLGSFRSGPV